MLKNTSLSLKFNTVVFHLAIKCISADAQGFCSKGDISPVIIQSGPDGLRFSLIQSGRWWSRDSLLNHSFYEPVLQLSASRIGAGSSRPAAPAHFHWNTVPGRQRLRLQRRLRVTDTPGARRPPFKVNASRFSAVSLLLRCSGRIILSSQGATAWLMVLDSSLILPGQEPAEKAHSLHGTNSSGFNF